MAGSGVAVEVERACRFEDAVQLDQARGHHGEVGHEVAAAEHVLEGFDAGGDLAAVGEGFFVGLR